ncbi:TrbJ/VirB5 family protein, partial [Burkholderia cepacia]|uniref:type IV secretion system protein n=1 Tax=Burkholderia cepacia TaxID=292 RepID=UPI002ABD8F89
QGAYAGGVPTVSIPELQMLQQNLTKLSDQIKQMRAQYDAVTGTYQRGKQFIDDAVHAAKSVPGSWRDVVAAQRDGVLGQLNGIKDSYEQILRTVSAKDFADKHFGANYEMSSNAVRSTLAGSQAIFDEAQTHLNNFIQLSQQIDTTRNVKDAADLQNRMSGELGLAQASQMKLQALVASVNANQLNSYNQGVADMQRYLS